MIAQLSPSAPRTRSSSSSMGVRWAGYFSTYSGEVVVPQTSTSSTSIPAARTKIRTVMLFTLGFRMFSVLDIWLLPLVGVSAREVSTCTRFAASCPGDELDRGLNDEHLAHTGADRVGELVVGLGAASQLDGDRQRRLLLHPTGPRPHEDVAADPRCEAAHHLAHGRGKDVDAADDQHLVGAAHAAYARPGP